MIKLILIGVVVTVVGLFAMKKVDLGINKPNVPPISEIIPNGNEVKVVITGQVLRPGEYIVLPTDSLLTLIEKAGGTTDQADPNSFTPGLLIGSYTDFYISPKVITPGACPVEPIRKYNINTAMAEELKKIGLTSSQITSLIQYRSEHGTFVTIEDLKLVSGIGDKTFIAIRDLVTLK